jgi:hypothetical protein
MSASPCESVPWWPVCRYFWFAAYVKDGAIRKLVQQFCAESAQLG